ncbi:ATP-binding cassette domain-containing protein [Candidatus Gracilibacteria bacterium]|nr:ATP-binding cassette domain-containing protein [Candidatus Gracilibacteria bacterium]
MKILELKKVVKYLNGNNILKEVSFEVEKGDIYGFLGPNGAGKTTTMKCIMGLIEPEEGEIKIFGENGITLEAKKKIGFMPENTYLYKHLTGAEFLRFNGKFFDIKKDELEKRIEKLLKKVGLENAGNKKLSDYSKGMLQRIGLAQSIINEPKLLFLDEPMSGLDPLGRKMVKDLLLDLQEDGTTIFFNTHILADAESMCNKISIIHKGEIIVESKKVKDIDENLEDYFIHNIEKSE